MINLKFGIHQINTVTGDISGNTNKIKEQIFIDHTNGCDLSIFPETAFSGYMCGSLWDRTDFVNKQDEQVDVIKDYIDEISYKGTVIVGFIDFIGFKTNGFPHLKNAAAIINEKGIRIYHKQLLASADHHEDKKYFDRGDETKVFKLSLPNAGTIRLGVLICEDAWSLDHIRNIPSEMVIDKNADLLVHINQSYFYYGKQQKRRKQFSEIARLCEVPMISVNSCGVGDILKNIVIFDGGSTVFNEKGKLLYEAPQFEEFNKTLELNKLIPMDFNTDVIRANGTEYVPNKLEEITKALIFEQREFFRLAGIQKAQVHISGGIDSAIVAALAVKAMGKENCVFITNPSSLNEKSLDYVEMISKKLGVTIWENPIQSIYDEFMLIHTQSFDWVDLSPTGRASVQATLRTVQGIAASHQFGSGIIATGNHTEIVLGWASFHDIGSIGVHALIGDLTKLELYGLAAYINSTLFRDEVIPEDLYNGKFPPAAELPDAMEDPIDYYIQSGICALLIRERMGRENVLDELMKSVPNLDYFPYTSAIKKYKVNELRWQIDFAIEAMRRSVYKAAQAAPIVIISPRSRGFSNRETLINKYKP